MRVRYFTTVHVSWRIAALAAGFITGVASAPLFSLDLVGMSWLIIGILLLCTALWRRSWLFLFVAFGSGFLLGGWHGAQRQQGLSLYAHYFGHTVSLQGAVAEDVDADAKSGQKMRLRDVRVDGQSLPGQVWVSTPSKRPMKRSDEVALRGKLREGFGNMAASLPRAELISVSGPATPDYARQIRDHFADGVRRALPSTEASLGVGYLVGQRTTLPEELDEQLKVVGLTHAVVASGYNLTILVGFARRTLLGASKYLATLASTCMILAFVLVTGLSPSMSRAGLVTGLSLATWYYGRAIHPFVLLPLAAALTLIIDPSFIWGDLGWYLSFASFVGLVVIAPLLKRYFWPADAKDNTVRGIFLETTSAQMATLPIMLYSFNQLAPYAILANMLVLPLVPLAMLLTFISGLAGLLAPGAAELIGLPATVVLRYMVHAIGHVADVPGAKNELGFSLSALCISYFCMAMFLIAVWRSTKHSFRTGTTTLIGERL